MKQRLWKQSWLPSAALAILIAVAACGDQSPLPSEPALGPEGASFATEPNGTVYGNKLAGSIPQFYETAVIGPAGGRVGVEGFYLVVPKGAVAQETVFEFRSSSSTHIEVELTATSVGATTRNDVGAVGFSVPVRLSLSFTAAGGVPVWRQLKVVWVRDDGSLEPVPTRLNVATKVATGFLSHFSRYALAYP